MELKVIRFNFLTIKIIFEFHIQMYATLEYQQYIHGISFSQNKEELSFQTVLILLRA
jgi:hypothetical protein